MENFITKRISTLIGAIVIIAVAVVAFAGILVWQKYNDNNRKISYENCMNNQDICQPEPGESYRDCAIRYELNCRRASNVSDEDFKRWFIKTK